MPQPRPAAQRIRAREQRPPEVPQQHGSQRLQPGNGWRAGRRRYYGVVSKAKTEGIHSFGDKSKYNEWFFIYDPTQDTGQGC